MYRKVAFLTLTVLLVLTGSAFSQTVPAGGWTGNVAVGSATAGSATEDHGTYTVTGNGDDIWNNADAFQYLYRELTGDGSMTARVTDDGSGSSTWAKGGVMIRQSTDAGSTHCMAVMTDTDGGGGSFQQRLTTGGASTNSDVGSGLTEPYWVRISRVGNAISGYFSPDGVTWTQQGTAQTIAMTDPVLIGLCVTSHAAGELRTFTFDNLSYTGLVTGLSDPGAASGPVPNDESYDVIRDSVLSWKQGMYPAKHNVYFGTTFEDVNSATTPDASNLDVNSFDPGRMEFGQDYYWRVDEVNTSPDKTVYKGTVWTFTAEPYSIMIPATAIDVNASSSSNEFSMPEKAIDGSGLGANNKHAIGSETMWFTSQYDPDPWIQFTFDEVKKLDAMKVWNSNSSAEMAIGWGVKAVEILYSVDGENWDVLADANQFSRAPGNPNYNQPDEINFGGVAAQYVRLNIKSNWGGILKSYGLSEVQFYMIPAAARMPVPASGTANVLPNSTIKWRAGREAGTHTIYVSTDVNAVIDGLAPSVSSNTNSLNLTSLDLQLGETYYWRVDEVNDAEATTVWPGPVWSMSIPSTLIVDDFEQYTNESPNKIFQTWIDGYGYTTPEPGKPGNGTGAALGHDNWTPSSPYYGLDFMETGIVQSGNQSTPFYYDGASQIDRTWTTPLNWSGNGITTLVLYFHGQAGNTGGPIYVKINGKKVTYPNAAALSTPIWYQWNINLASLGMSLSSISSMNIGVEGSGSGLVYIDNIRLYKVAPEVVLPTPLSTDGLIASYNMENNVLDGSGHSLNGTLVGTPTYVQGRNGMAMQFDGIGACVDLGNKAAFNPVGSFSVAVWANITDWTADWAHVMVGNRGEDGVGWQLRRRNNNKISWTTRGVGSDDDPSSRMDAPLNEWVLIVGTYDMDKNIKRLYVNGSLSAQTTTTPTTVATNLAGTMIVPTTHNTYIGARALADNTGRDSFFTGMLDDVLLYNRAISEAEVRYMAGDR